MSELADSIIKSITDNPYDWNLGSIYMSNGKEDWRIVLIGFCWSSLVWPYWGLSLDEPYRHKFDMSDRVQIMKAINLWKLKPLKSKI